MKYRRTPLPFQNAGRIRAVKMRQTLLECREFDWSKISPAIFGTMFQGSSAEKPLALDLQVRVINVNKGHNEKILGRCEVLRGYAVFIGQVRDRQQLGLSLADAITDAIDFCVSNGILVEYLKNNSPEVRNMLFTEFNLEEAKEVWFGEGIEKGIENGKLDDATAMFAEGISLEKIARITNLPLEQLKEKLRIQ